MPTDIIYHGNYNFNVEDKRALFLIAHGQALRVPKISIIIPMYNTEQYIEETLKSALAQTYKNFEVIVVDDGSTDRSFEIASKYPVKIIKQRNLGQAMARNAGVAVSMGEFILPLDSDDLIDPTYLEKTVLLIVLTHTDVVATSMKRFGEINDIIEPTMSDLNHNGIPSCSLIRRSAFEAAGGYDSEIRHEDWDLWLGIIGAGKKIIFRNEPLFLYRVRMDGTNADADKNKKKWFEEIQKKHRWILSKEKTALVLLATGKQYHQYIQQLLDSAKKYFVPHIPILWTDSEKQFTKKQFFLQDQGYPTTTLMRYHIFLGQHELLRKFDYIYYCDIDMTFVSEIKREDVFTQGITATRHAGYLNTPGTPETRKESTAYLESPQTYFAGGFVGGSRDAFLQMARTLAKNISIDKSNGVLAKWHDESHLQLYLHDNPPVSILGPEFCYPDAENAKGYMRHWAGLGYIPETPRLVVIDKGFNNARPILR